MRDYYEQLYMVLHENLEEVDRFLESYNLPKPNKGVIENLNRLFTSKEMELLRICPKTKDLVYLEHW